MTRRAVIEAMVERAMERATADIAKSLKPMVGDYVADYSEPDLEAWRAPVPELESLLRNSSPIRLTPEQKREKANAYMRAYKERKKAERARSAPGP